MSQHALILFARAPEVGKVKTRLGADLGAEAATLVYARLLARSLWLGRQWPGPRFLACADRRSFDYFLHLLPAGHWTLFEQSGLDLGERMHNAFAHVLAHAPGALLMGSDIVDATLADLLEAGYWLAAGVDVVLGPAADGGYWLIGLTEPRPALFSHMPWSTPGVAASTRARCATLGLRREELPVRHDVDDSAGLRLHAGEIEAFAALPLLDADPRGAG
jgi:rSAM/selenodomain-associated transferase 1